MKTQPALDRSQFPSLPPVTRIDPLSDFSFQPFFPHPRHPRNPWSNSDAFSPIPIHSLPRITRPHRVMPLNNDQDGVRRFAGKCLYLSGMSGQKGGQVTRRAISRPHPNDLGRCTQENTSLLIVRILGDDDEGVDPGVLPDDRVVARPQTTIMNVCRAGIPILYRANQ